jgi:hypothetical protein
MSTVDKGNSFRDVVDSLLAAAGFHTDKEVRLDFKKADLALWITEQFSGPARFAVEAKDYGQTLPLSECSAFVAQYGSLVENRKIDGAWLVSRGPISPDGQAQIEAKHGLSCFTFESFQRRLLNLDAYLRDLIDAYDKTSIARFYVPPHSVSGCDLEKLVRDWINADGAAPLAIIAGYGMGKSTFAKHLSASLAAEALANPIRRVPILVTLGEIVDEQSVDGLIGKVLASRYRAGNYHFHLFEALNRAGRFIIIFDGFDEMKHGMTLSMFERNISELLRLDGDKARLLILGRPTAFHNDEEFRAIILGRQRTPAGREVAPRDRRAFETADIRNFTPEEAREFVRTYFNLKVLEEAKRNGSSPDALWVEGRSNELAGDAFAELVVRPVHAQMLCEIATQPDISLNVESRFDLYDTFIHYLLDREAKKRGRSEAFDVSRRRTFNCALAWWLWEKGGAATTTLASIPSSICLIAAAGVEHEFDEEGLRRELTAGCLIEKAGDTIYFAHRSIQEFLVAEHLFDSHLLDARELGHLVNLLNEEVVDFLSARVAVEPDAKRIARNWIDILAHLRGHAVSAVGFDLFVRLGRLVGESDVDPTQNSWRYWIRYFMANGGVRFDYHHSARAKLIELFSAGLSAEREIQATALEGLERMLRAESRPPTPTVADFVAAWLRYAELAPAVSRARSVRKFEHHYVQQAEAFALWCFLSVAKLEAISGQESGVAIDLDRLNRILVSPTRGTIEQASQWPPGQTVRVTTQAIYSALSRRGIKHGQLEDTYRPFLGSIDLFQKVRPQTRERRSGRNSTPHQ